MKLARVFIIAASTMLLFFGLLHLHGTFFSTDLHPDSEALTELLKSSHIRMDKSGNLWKLWIGFNAMFSAGLVFIGSVILYLGYKHFQWLSGHNFVLLVTIIVNAFFVWIGYKYMIQDFVLSMSIPLCLFVAGFILAGYKTGFRAG